MTAFDVPAIDLGKCAQSNDGHFMKLLIDCFQKLAQEHLHELEKVRATMNAMCDRDTTTCTHFPEAQDVVERLRENARGDGSRVSPLRPSLWSLIHLGRVGCCATFADTMELERRDAVRPDGEVCGGQVDPTDFVGDLGAQHVWKASSATTAAHSDAVPTNEIRFGAVVERASAELPEVPLLGATTFLRTSPVEPEHQCGAAGAQVAMCASSQTSVVRSESVLASGVRFDVCEVGNASSQRSEVPWPEAGGHELGPSKTEHVFVASGPSNEILSSRSRHSHGDSHAAGLDCAPGTPNTLFPMTILAPATIRSPFVSVSGASGSFGEKSAALPTTRHALDVTLIEASGLRDADGWCFLGSSDPYVVCEVRGKPNTRFQTKVVMNNLRPVWNHEHVITDFQMGDVLEFVVYDSDFHADDFLGAAHLCWNDFCEDGFFGALPLSSSPTSQDESAGVLVVQVALKGPELGEEEEMANLQELLSAAQARWPLKSEYDGSSSFFRSSSLSMDMDRVSYHDAVVDVSGLGKYVVISPVGFNAVCWNVIGIACVLADIALVPLLLAFDMQQVRSVTYISFALVLYWTLNIPRTFVTGVFLNGVVEMRMSLISSTYAKTWLLPDLVLCSVDWFGVLLLHSTGETGDEASLSTKMVRVFRAVRFARSLSLLRLFKMQDAIERYLDTISMAPLRCFLNVTAIVSLMLIFCHYLGCIWYVIGIDADDDGWVHRLGVSEHGSAYEYMSSIHWALTQFMPASSGIQAGNLLERAYVFAVDVFGFVCFSFFVSNVQMQLNSLKNVNAERQRQMAEMRLFFSERSVPLSVASTVTEFVRRAQRLKRIKKVTDVQAFKSLPVELLRKLNTEIYRGSLKGHPLMSCLSRLDRRVFSRLCHETLVERPVHLGLKLFEQESVAVSMYFVSSGIFLYSRNVHVVELSAGAWAAEAAIWIKGWTHRGSMAAKRESIVLEIPAQQFTSCIFGGSERIRAVAKVYAAKFVRSGEHAEEQLRFSDVWSTPETLDEIVVAAEKFASKTRRSVSK